MSYSSQTWIRSLSIGIVSGAGPRAGVLLYQKVVEKCQQVYECQEDQDFPKIWILNYPFSPMVQVNESSQNNERLTGQIEDALSQLSERGVNRIGIACNTIHNFLPANGESMERLIQIPNLIKRSLKDLNSSSVLILGTETTIHLGMYRTLKQRTFYPNQIEQTSVSAIIDRILKGNILKEDSEYLENIISKYSYHIDSVILGCTELSVLADQFPIHVNQVTIVDPLDLLSYALISK